MLQPLHPAGRPAGHCAPTWALDALEMAIWQRHGSLDGVMHPFVGDACDDALAEMIIGWTSRAGWSARPWMGIDQVEYATLAWADWFNHRRLLEPIGYVPPAEHEAACWRRETLSRTA
jgi:transposase InsO family protein